MKWVVALVALLSMLTSTSRAETPEQWIELGTRVHGGFGAFIPAGIRIGLDALERLKAERRGVTVTFYSGERSPCPCIADGVMLATQASPGQGTLQVAAEKAPAGLLAVVVIRDRKTGAGLRYTVTDAWMPKIADWNRTLDPAGRYQAAMSAPGLFEVADAR
jgi:formylmethanofuran dehydrogenase subunit E